MSVIQQSRDAGTRSEVALQRHRSFSVPFSVNTSSEAAHKPTPPLMRMTAMPMQASAPQPFSSSSSRAHDETAQAIFDQRFLAVLLRWVETVAILRLPWIEYSINPYLDAMFNQLQRQLNHPTAPTATQDWHWLWGLLCRMEEGGGSWNSAVRVALRGPLRELKLYLRQRILALSIATHDVSMSSPQLLDQARQGWHSPDRPVFGGWIAGTSSSPPVSVSPDSQMSPPNGGDSVWSLPMLSELPMMEVGGSNLSTVYRMQHPAVAGGDFVALKVYHFDESHARMTLDNERTALTHLPAHPNVVVLIRSFDDALILEWIHGEDLLTLVRRERSLDESTCRKLFHQMAQAVRHAHQHCTSHRDIKLENFMLECSPPPEKGGGGGAAPITVKLVDWGFAVEWSDKLRTQTLVCGSRHYLAPEVCCGSRKPYFPDALDIWSLGVCLYVMYTGWMPTLITLTPDTPFHHKFPYLTRFPPLFQQFLLFVLDPSASTRPNIHQVINHKWMSNQISSFNFPRHSSSPPPSPSSSSSSSSSSSQRRSSSNQPPSTSAPPSLSRQIRQFFSSSSSLPRSTDPSIAPAETSSVCPPSSASSSPPALSRQRRTLSFNFTRKSKSPSHDVSRSPPPNHNLHDSK